jgi:hypothetical protein
LQPVSLPSRQPSSKPSDQVRVRVRAGSDDRPSTLTTPPLVLDVLSKGLLIRSLLYIL